MPTGRTAGRVSAALSENKVDLDLRSPVRAHLPAGGEEGTSPSSVSPLSLSLMRCVLDTSTVRSGAAWLG